MGRYDTQHNDTQYNDTQHNDTQHNDTQHNNTQHTYFSINDTQHNISQHKALCVAFYTVVLNAIMLNVVALYLQHFTLYIIFEWVQ